MESDEESAQAIDPAADTSLLTENIKVSIPYRMQENIINTNSSGTSTPEKITPVITDLGDLILRQPESRTDQGQELHSPRSVDIPVQPLANVNCPERIVLCIDISSEMKERRYRAKAGSAFSGIDIVKRALKLFINNKQMLSSHQRHSFALIFLLDQALWVTDFTSDVSELFTQIDSLVALEEQGPQFDMSSLFDILMDKAKLPLLNNIDNASPPYVVRVILVYGRSHCLPVFESHEAQNLISGSQCFFMDIVYLHESASDDNQSEDIYQELCDLDTRGFSHIFDISRTPTKVFDAFGKLLAHPLQRAIQCQSGYRMEPLQSLIDGGDLT